MMEIKLKPCPMCGGTNLQTIASVTINEKRHSVYCLECEHRGPISLRSNTEAEIAWNAVADALHQEEHQEERQEEPATRKTILEAAEKCVCHDRQDAHGRPEDVFGDVAALWTAYIGDGSELDEVDVACMMTLLKIARAKSNPLHMDNWVDIAGYAACGGELAKWVNT